MGASYSDVFASATSADVSEDECEINTWSAQAFHRSGVLVWRVPKDDEPIKAAWVPYPDDDGPTMLINMTVEARNALGLRDVTWAELCAGLLADEVRRGRDRLGRDPVIERLECIDDKLDRLIDSV